VQLSVKLLPARDFWKSAERRDDWYEFFQIEVEPKDDEYVFNVINFIVGSNLICFYIALKRLKKDGNQFARLLPGRIAEIGCGEGHDYQPPPKLETIFIRQNLKLQPSIVDPRICGFSVQIGFPQGSAFIASLQEATELTGLSCP
jgi:hypothetical protein